MPHTLCAINTAAAGAWSPSGDILIGQIGDGIYRVSANGGNPVRITQPDPMKSETRHVLPQMLPGGRFVYVAASDKPGYSALWAASLDGRDRKAIMAVQSGATYAAGQLVFLQERALVAQAFNAQTLEVSGEPRPLAATVGTVPAMGSSLLIGDFAAGGRTLAYRTTAPSSLTLIQNMLRPMQQQIQSGADITVVRNWM
jgi:hypothetical protein